MYLFEDNPFGSMASRLQTHEVPDAAVRPRFAEPLFNSEERCVLALADRDSLSSLAQPGRIGRAIEWIFAIERLGPLANPGLETLRRTAIILRKKGSLTPEETRRFYERRYSAAHLYNLRCRYGLVARSAGNA